METNFHKMSDLWNLWDVKPPPVCSVKTELNFKGISSLSEVTFDALKTIRDLGYLDREAAILSRFLYKYQRIFRHDKGIQNLVKVNQCLKRYLKLDMSTLLFNFKQSLSHNFKPTSTIAYLPTKQMLKFILLRLQAFSHLFVRVIQLTKATGAYIYKKLCLGWSLNLSLMIFCTTARILLSSKFLVAKSIEWYSSFYKCLPYLQQTADFLPNYDFPPDLKLQLGEVDLVPLKKKTFIDDVFELIDLAKEDDEGEEKEDEDSEVQIINEKLIKTVLKVNIDANVDDDDDVEVIKVEEKVEKTGLKRPFEISSMDEDLGVPVNDEDENNEEEIIEISRRQRERFRKRKGNKRLKWFKKLKKL